MVKTEEKEELDINIKTVGIFTQTLLFNEKDNQTVLCGLGAITSNISNFKYYNVFLKLKNIKKIKNMLRILIQNY